MLRLLQQNAPCVRSTLVLGRVASLWLSFIITNLTALQPSFYEVTYKQPFIILCVCLFLLPIFIDRIALEESLIYEHNTEEHVLVWLM